MTAGDVDVKALHFRIARSDEIVEFGVVVERVHGASLFPGRCKERLA